MLTKSTLKHKKLNVTKVFIN